MYVPRGQNQSWNFCETGRRCRIGAEDAFHWQSRKIITLSCVVVCELILDEQEPGNSSFITLSWERGIGGCLPLAVISECHQLQRLNSTRNLNRGCKSPGLFGHLPSWTEQGHSVLFSIAHCFWNNNTLIRRYPVGFVLGPLNFRWALSYLWKVIWSSMPAKPWN